MIVNTLQNDFKSMQIRISARMDNTNRRFPFGLWCEENSCSHGKAIEVMSTGYDKIVQLKESNGGTH